jgi:recombination protein RecT
VSTDTVKQALATRQEGGTPTRTVYDLLEQQKTQIARALPKHMSAERFARIVLTECRRTPRLMGCTPESLLGAVMLSAQLGLEPGPLGHCYLLPFRNTRNGTTEVQFLIGYKGLIDLARRSGNIESIVAREVCEHDEFEFEYGLDERLVHRPALTDRGNPIAYYAVAKYRDGGHTMMVMSLDDIAARRARSRAKDSGPWVTDFDAMARKTVIRAMASYLPLSIEAAQAVLADETVTTDLGPDVLEHIAPPDDEVIDVDGQDVDPNPAPVSTGGEEGAAGLDGPQPDGVGVESGTPPAAPSSRRRKPKATKDVAEYADDDPQRPM